jgi:succinate-semialdehyde dehydrogenase/glutarate-semialdehyde dehydrogenase
MATTASIQVRSPATGEELGEVAITSPAEIDAAVRAAREAQPLLEEMTVHERAALLHRAADIVEERHDELAHALALEQGKPLRTEAVEEIEETAGNLRMAAEDAKRMDTAVIPSERRGKIVLTFRKPIGVFATITPWNFPMMIPSELIAPALATGNAVILKPSEFTPLSGRRLVEILEEAELPPGAIGIVHGAREAGETLVTHPGVDAIGFVGSHGTGEAIVRAAGMKRTLIEASGNGPQIVLADADLGAAAAAAVEGAAYLAGQVCVATERVLVEERAHDEFVELVLARAGEVVLGHPLDEATTMGPLNNEPVAAKMDRHMADAGDRGARILAGGGRAGGFPTDLYYEMTVVDAVTPETLLFREESFGPVLPITTFRSDDEAIALANDTNLGLQAAVFTSSLRRAFRFVNEVRAGNIQVNETTGYWEGRPPFGGAAGTKTGWGRIQLEDFTDLRTATIDYLNTPDA